MSVALVAGASGIIGHRIATHLVASGWEVIGLARRPHSGPAQRHVCIDLLDAADTQAKLASLDGITHLFYAARYDHPEGVPESETRNTAMLRNILDALRSVGGLHVNLVHGTKYYGHPQRIPCPVTEEMPRGTKPTFYFAQEDLVRECTERDGWTWSIARPHIFCDPAIEHPRSIGLVIAVYAAVQRELREPLFFPGSRRSYESRTQFTDTALLAQALRWMSRESRCANQAFNVVNGDALRWSELWSHFAHVFGIEAGGPADIRLAEYMRDKMAVWDAAVHKHSLRPVSLGRMALWDYGDYVFRPEWDIISSMNKARELGFDHRVDTKDMFSRVFAAYREQRVTP